MTDPKSKFILRWVANPGRAQELDYQPSSYQRCRKRHARDAGGVSRRNGCPPIWPYDAPRQGYRNR